jgi:hypothetical protein
LIATVGVGAVTARSTIFGGANGTGDVPYQFAATVGHVTPAPPGASLSALVQSVVSRYGGRLLVSAKVTDPPTSDHPAGPWLSVVAHVPDGYATQSQGWQPAFLEAGWQADLVAGAISDAAAEHGLGKVAGATISGLLSDGSTVPSIGGGIGAVTTGQSFSADSDEQISAALKEVLTAADLVPLSVNVLHADQPAPAVIAQTADPAKAAANAESTINSLFGGHPPKYEGYYLEVRDTTGAPVFVVSYAYRAGSGRRWVDPKFQDSLSHY